MLVSTRGRYALRVMIDLAEHSEDPYVPLKEVARRQGISEKYLENIAKLLVKAGLLSGLRGKSGGYRLARAPEDYTVGEVLRLTEGTLAPVSCLSEGAGPCPRAADCRTVPMWRGLNEAITSYLDGVTLKDLIRPKAGEGGGAV